VSSCGVMHEGRNEMMFVTMFKCLYFVPVSPPATELVRALISKVPIHRINMLLQPFNPAHLVILPLIRLVRAHARFRTRRRALARRRRIVQFFPDSFECLGHFDCEVFSPIVKHLFPILLPRVLHAAQESELDVVLLFEVSQGRP
jgi:hypothetical protein